ncbi:hypothetical protein JW897_12165 [Chromobacterium alkanivorans]|uniref:hypothetical protein n=1 Tax=Chromobacterium alkanivorans TaxID=1071719 RepID=UPI00196851D3|nr:hypothetical protein [Chromobacterium alkanivorans]MBN3004490.1 hypothetical protein [Chromobacterium alkanivorans]
MSDDSAWQEQARSALHSLSPRPRTTTKAERFRTMLPDIEASIRNDISHADIIAALARAGLTMTESEFRNALCRERKRQKGKPSETSKTQPPAAPTPAAAPNQPTATRKPGDHRQSRDRNPNW